MNLLNDKVFRSFILKFILIFSVGYFGTQVWIGLAAPGGHYVPFIEKYLDYISWMQVALLKGSQFVLLLFGIETYTTADFHLRYVNGRGVLLAFDCVGYGVMSFWIALIIALPGKIVKKISWILLGLSVLYIINVARISLFLVVTNKNTTMPLGLDHHTWFNIFAYIAIFTLLYFFYSSTSEKKSEGKNQSDKTVTENP